MKICNPRPRSDLSVNRSMRVILDVLNPLGVDLILMKEPKKAVYLCVSVRGEDTELPNKPGQVEYMVSNGKPGHRSFGHSFDNLSEAIGNFNEIVKNGWRR